MLRGWRGEPIFIAGRIGALHHGLPSKRGRRGGSIAPSNGISKRTIGTSALL
jgi:hypothetical protein